jgi:hypothetical protein
MKGNHGCTLAVSHLLLLLNHGYRLSAASIARTSVCPSVGLASANRFAFVPLVPRLLPPP